MLYRLELGALLAFHFVINIIMHCVHWGHSGRVVTFSPPTSEAWGSIPVMASSGKAGS